jgi:nitrous oxidase accessory protein
VGPSAGAAVIAGLIGAIVITVAPGGRVPSLSAALAQAHAGDTIVVESGRYLEAAVVRIDRRVTIVGRGRPILDAGGNHTLLLVTADSVAIEGLDLENIGPSSTDDRAAIRLEGVRGCRVVDNHVRNSFFGIFGAKVTDCVISGNTVTGPSRHEQQSGNAIQLWYSGRVTVTGNVVQGHRDGIYLEFVTNSRLEDNESRGNERYGLHFMFSDSCTYRRNRFHDNGAGVAVMYSKRVTMERNQFTTNRGQAAYGLLLKDISDGSISGNLFQANTTGLYLEGSNRLQVRENRFEGNGWALRVLANATDNLFERNTFLGNAFDVTTNSRSATSTFQHNYWDRYQGFDLDHDGFGDVPHRPVRLFSLVVEQNEPALILLRSLFVDLLDAAERVLPILTPEALVDSAPLMERPR